MPEDTGPSIEGSLHSYDGKGVVRMTARFASPITEVWSAITVPARLASWYGKVEGDLRVGGEFTAVVLASGWDGRGRIDACDAPRQLRVITWEQEGAKEAVSAELTEDGDHTALELEVLGPPLDKLYAYGAGWQVHVEDLAAHLAGHERPSSDTRWDELEVAYRAMIVEPLLP